MAISEKKIAANRANAQKSCGPNSAEGKARSRQNALKHGLSGSGIVVPEEDRGRFEGRLDRWAEEVGAEGDLERYLVSRAALASVRLDRCSRFEVASLDRQRRRARRRCDEGLDRVADVDAHGARLAADPVAALAGLSRTAAGCDQLLTWWAWLRADLDGWGHWEPKNLDFARSLLGLPKRPTVASPPPVAAFWRAALESAAEPDPRELARFLGLPRGADDRIAEALGRRRPPEVARAALIRRIDRIIARLGRRRARLDAAVDAPALARAEARADFDATPAGALLRRYESACSNDLHRALNQLHAARRATASAPAPRETKPPGHREPSATEGASPVSRVPLAACPPVLAGPEGTGGQAAGGTLSPLGDPIVGSGGAAPNGAGPGGFDARNEPTEAPPLGGADGSRHPDHPGGWGPYPDPGPGAAPQDAGVRVRTPATRRPDSKGAAPSLVAPDPLGVRNEVSDDGPTPGVTEPPASPRSGRESSGASRLVGAACALLAFWIGLGGASAAAIRPVEAAGPGPRATAGPGHPAAEILSDPSSGDAGEARARGPRGRRPSAAPRRAPARVARPTPTSPSRSGSGR